MDTGFDTIPARSPNLQSFSTLEKSPVPSHFPPVVNSIDDSKKLFELAESRWNSAFNVERFEQTLRDITKEGMKPNVDLFRELKDLRKHALILHSAWNLFNEDHTPPGSYMKLVHTLGELNDEYFTDNAPQKAEKCSKSLQKYLKKRGKKTFAPASPESFRNNLESIVSNMNNQLHDNDINGKEFHILRKEGTRFLMNIYQLASLLHPENQSFRQSFEILHNLDQQLGSIKDTLESEKHTTTMSEQSFVIDPELRHSLDQLIHAFSPQ